VNWSRQGIVCVLLLWGCVLPDAVPGRDDYEDGEHVLPLSDLGAALECGEGWSDGCATSPGAPLWTQRYDGPASAGDYGYGVAIAGDGAVLVVGDSYVEGEGMNLWLARYESSGALAWSRTLHGGEPGQAQQDAGRAIALGPQDAIFVTGFSYQPETGFDALVARFDARGELEWMRTHDGPVSGLDAGHAIVRLDDDALLIAGAPLTFYFESLVNAPGSRAVAGLSAAGSRGALSGRR
jgi:hypothetical protein